MRSSAGWAPTLVMLAASLMAVPAWAEVFRLGEVDGFFDISLAYGLLIRTESRDREFIGVGNGGGAATGNLDDGDLNDAKDIVANGVRATAELTLKWRNFGAYVRGYGFYDFKTELDDRKHTALSADADDLVAISQPTTTARDAFVRQGMLWAAANLTETIAIEGFYQYDWQEVRAAPVGWFFSVDDLIGADGTGQAFSGFGQFSDRGTELDAYCGLTPGMLEFDRNFMKIPTLGRNKPDRQGQFGFTI